MNLFLRFFGNVSWVDNYSIRSSSHASGRISLSSINGRKDEAASQEEGRKIVCLESKFLKHFVFYTAPSRVGIFKTLLLSSSFLWGYWKLILLASSDFVFQIHTSNVLLFFFEEKIQAKIFHWKKNRRELSLH